jgi:hypothetical protein
MRAGRLGRAILGGLWTGAALALIGCGGENDAGDRLQAVAERGPLSLEVCVKPAAPRVGDVVTVELVFSAPEAYEARLPGIDAFGALGAAVDADVDPRPGPEGVVWQRRYTFVPLFSGALEIPALAVAYRRTSPDPVATRPAETELVSEPLALTVASALTAEDSPTEPRDITGTLQIPRQPLPLWARILIGLAIPGVIVLLVLGYRWWRAWVMRPLPPIPAEVWALRELEALTRGAWYEPERVRASYYRLTEVVRSYIERKFRVAAPDMTTEEFLGLLARERHALPYDADRLREFLEACDFVKYACVSPRQEDAEAILASARSFIHATSAAADRVRDVEPQPEAAIVERVS